jgi:hypothetical protein
LLFTFQASVADPDPGSGAFDPLIRNLLEEKKLYKKIYFNLSLLVLLLDQGSGMAKNHDPGFGIRHNISDPQHCLKESRVLFR